MVPKKQFFFVSTFPFTLASMTNYSFPFLGSFRGQSIVNTYAVFEASLGMKTRRSKQRAVRSQLDVLAFALSTQLQIAKTASPSVER